MLILNSVYQPTRADADLTIFMARTGQLLIECFIGLSPEKTAQDFQNDVLMPVRLSDNLLIDNPSEIFMQFLSESDLDGDFAAKTKAPLINATAYFCRALKAYDIGQFSATWSYLVDANYWCGFSSSYRGMGIARDKTIVETEEKVLWEHRSKGGTGKKINNLPYKLEAEDLARTMRSTWKNPSQATHIVLDKLNQEYEKREQKFPLKYHSIYLHFKSLHDADKLFNIPSKK